jgi:sugar lactone lactonase YvrE
LLAGRLGTEEVKDVDGSAAEARFMAPSGIAADGAGNVYVTNLSTTLRKIAANGTVSTLGGNANDVAVDRSGNLWVVEGTRIRRIAPNGTVTTVADLGQDAQAIGGIAIGPDGSAYVIDTQTVRKVNSAGVVSIVAGSTVEIGTRDGVGTGARFTAPRGIAVDATGNIFVTERNVVRRIASNGAVATIAGGDHPGAFADGSGAQARFNEPIGIVADSSGNVYVADSVNHVIRRVAANGDVTTLAGQAGKPGVANGSGAAATLYFPVGLSIDRDGSLLVAERGNHVIRKVTPSGAVTIAAGQPWLHGPDDGVGTAARFNRPGPLAVDEAGNLYVADIGNSTVRKVTPDGTVSTVAGTVGVFLARDGLGRAASFANLTGIAVDKGGSLYVTDAGGCYRKMDCTNGGVSNPAALVRKITASGTVTSLAGGRTGDSFGAPALHYGSGLSAELSWPSGLVVDPAGSLYVANCGTTALFKVTQDGVVSKLVDDVCQVLDDWSTTSSPQPKGMVRDAQGNVYLAESANSRIVKISPDGKVTWIGKGAPYHGTVDGAAAEAQFNRPEGIAIDSKGNLYVADTRSDAIRKIAADGTVSTFAGKAATPGVKLGVLPGGLTKPSGIAIDGKDVMYISTENAIVKVPLNP